MIKDLFKFIGNIIKTLFKIIKFILTNIIKLIKYTIALSKEELEERKTLNSMNERIQDRANEFNDGV